MRVSPCMDLRPGPLLLLAPIRSRRAAALWLGREESRLLLAFVKHCLDFAASCCDDSLRSHDGSASRGTEAEDISTTTSERLATMCSVQAAPVLRCRVAKGGLIPVGPSPAVRLDRCELAGSMAQRREAIGPRPSLRSRRFRRGDGCPQAAFADVYESRRSLVASKPACAARSNRHTLDSANSQETKSSGLLLVAGAPCRCRTLGTALELGNQPWR